MLGLIRCYAASTCHSLLQYKRLFIFFEAILMKRIELTLSHCESITDEGIRHLCSGEMRQSLELIDLDNCPLLTDISLRLLENCPLLRQLELVDCHHISKTGIDRLERKIVKQSLVALFNGSISAGNKYPLVFCSGS